ncbi:Guanine nucleotide-binding protein subunit beta-like protein [Hondaea fermentalgiana]|uniref:Guanine nucleotide-binding protein subunit beta-like protein n=1 Tax=Hondaea fermentalgiana TaxID=2315210 RepID=A0A2R5GKE7_9STRA|nr:Guanine nucleotide-binding protein subunit beta-like protein [Hondaea fermentalgiana]|eukprot:GBG31350.1 Guanine nucleotide-binding protein subunit beta-like protein [Hondaea fermentalgiana]
MGRIQHWVRGVAQSADLVLAASVDGFLRVWRKKDGVLVLEMKTPNNKAANAVAVQGKLAVLGTDGGGLLLMDLATVSVLHALEGHTGGVYSVVFDGNDVISGSYDETICVWDTVSGQMRSRIDVGQRVYGVAIHEDLLVAGLKDNTVRVFDRASGDPRHVLTEATNEVTAVAIDAQHMVSGSWDCKVRVYAVPSFELVHVLEGHNYSVRSVALDKFRIVSGSDDNTIRVWDARSGDLLHVLQGHADTVLSVSLAGQEIVSGSWDQSVRVWDTEMVALARVLDGTEAEMPISEIFATETESDAKTEQANENPAESRPFCSIL